MNKELELWHFVADRLRRKENVMLLVVAESSGSSPGRQGYKMAVGADGALCGSIGGGVMEVNLVEQGRSTLLDTLQNPARSKGEMLNPSLIEQIHRKDSPNSSGMICSGKQTVIFKFLGEENADTVDSVVRALRERRPEILSITPNEVAVSSASDRRFDNFHFETLTDTDFVYTEQLGFKSDLIIIGGGHCALALCELISRMDFHISIFDDRPELNTIEKNRFAHEIAIIDSYENIGNAITSGDNTYVVVMTLGYRSDAIVMRHLIDKEFKYFGILGSRAKMATLLKELKREGFPAAKLDRIHTPIGLPINSRTPEEIAVSIAAQIISIKNT